MKAGQKAADLQSYFLVWESARQSEDQSWPCCGVIKVPLPRTAGSELVKEFGHIFELLEIVSNVFIAQEWVPVRRETGATVGGTLASGNVVLARREIDGRPIVPGIPTPPVVHEHTRYCESCRSNLLRCPFRAASRIQTSGKGRERGRRAGSAANFCMKRFFDRMLA